MKLIKSLSILAAFNQLMMGSVFADQCSDILANGIFNSIFSSSTSSTAEQLNEWLESTTYESVKNKVDAGLSIPISGFPIGANFNKESFRQYQQDLKQGKTTGFTQTTAAQFVEQNASDAIVDAWIKCMEIPKYGPALQIDPNKNAPEQLTVSGRFFPLNQSSQEPTITGFFIQGQATIQGENPLAKGNLLSYGGATASLLRKKGADGSFPSITATLNTTSGTASATTKEEQIKNNSASPPLIVQLIPGMESASSQHPEASVTVPPGYKVIGGGAQVIWEGFGNLLTASYPTNNGMTWTVRSKDHDIQSAATITPYAIALYDPQDQWEVRIFQDQSAASSHPEVTVRVDSGYVMTGGGAYSNYSGAGNLLTAMYPVSDNTWGAESKDHMNPDPSVLTAYAIGIRPRAKDAPLPTVKVTSFESLPQSHPTASVAVADGFTLTGGGAKVRWNAAGNLLTAVFPQGNSYKAFAKDHELIDPARITVYAVGLRVAQASKPMSISVQKPKSFLSSVNWMTDSYVSPRTGQLVRFREGKQFTREFLTDLRSIEVAAPHIHWQPNVISRPALSRPRLLPTHPKLGPGN